MICNKILKTFKVLRSGYSVSQISKQANLFNLQKRELSFFYQWFINIFNGVDVERLQLVGPNCACAEWLLRNGASVRFKGHSELLSDYNELIALEEIEAKKLIVEEIYARDAALNAIGFNHLKNCDDVKKVTLIFCTHITDSALAKFSYVKKSLEYLEMRSCFNVKDKGLISLQNLGNLKTLILSDLVSVKDKDSVEAALRKALPQCNIDYTN